MFQKIKAYLYIDEELFIFKKDLEKEQIIKESKKALNYFPNSKRAVIYMYNAATEELINIIDLI